MDNSEQLEPPAPVVSVVVIGRNEGTRLRRCIKSVQEAEHPANNSELIYVDSGSIDGSVALAEAEGGSRSGGPFSVSHRGTGT